MFEINLVKIDIGKIDVKFTGNRDKIIDEEISRLRDERRRCLEEIHRCENLALFTPFYEQKAKQLRECKDGLDSEIVDLERMRQVRQTS